MDLGDANLLPIKVLGQGTFGRVFLCKNLENGKETNCCVKRIIIMNPKTEMCMIKEEIYIISQLRHPNIIEFIRYFLHAGTVNIVMEYASNGTLRDVINKCHSGRLSKGLDKTELLHYFSDMFLGLEYLHIRRVIHRDIKPENMLLDAQNRIKIADFGIASVHTTPAKSYTQLSAGTPLYMAPEIMRGEKFCFKSDIWSLGVVLYELCLGRNPFTALLLTGKQTIEQLHNVVRALTRHKLDCQIIRLRYGAVWARVCELMVVYDVQRRIALPDIMCLDTGITLNVYKQYFNYKY